MVVVTMAMMAAIAAPRLSSAGERSRQGALVATTEVYQRTIDFYTAEHADHSPAFESGVLDNDGALFIARLTTMTNESGGTTGATIFGPYFRSAPINPMNGKTDVRIDGDPAGVNKAGWRFDSVKALIEPDDSSGIQIITVRRGGGKVSLDAGKVDDGEIAVGGKGAVAVSLDD